MRSYFGSRESKCELIGWRYDRRRRRGSCRDCSTFHKRRIIISVNFINEWERADVSGVTLNTRQRSLQRGPSWSTLRESWYSLLQEHTAEEKDGNETWELETVQMFDCEVFHFFLWWNYSTCKSVPLSEVSQTWIRFQTVFFQILAFQNFHFYLINRIKGTSVVSASQMILYFFIFSCL